MAETLHAITDWADIFEPRKARRPVNGMEWVRIPTRGGGGYNRLMEEPDGVTIYGAWILLVLEVAKLPASVRDGRLIDKHGHPLTPRMLANKAGVKTEQKNPSLFARALEVLTLPEIGWLHIVDKMLWDVGNGVKSDATASSCVKSDATASSCVKSDATASNVTAKRRGERERERERDNKSEKHTHGGGVGGVNSPTPPGGRPNGSAERVCVASRFIDQIYGAYPRKVGAKVARDVIRAKLRALVGEHQTVEAAAAWLLGRTEEYATTVRGTDPKFIPHPRTWFSQERYRDDFETQATQRGKRPGRVEAPVGKYDDVSQ